MPSQLSTRGNRFSLRALLVAVLATGAGLGMLARFVSAQSERSRLLEFLDVGLGHAWTPQWASAGNPAENAVLGRIVPEIQQNFDAPTGLQSVFADATRLAGRRLAALPELKSIWLRYASDADLAGLVGIDRLENLAITEYRGTAEGLRLLSAHNRLRRLTISGRLTSADLEALGSLPGIEAFWIDFAQVDLGGEPVTRDLIRQHLRQAEQGQAPSLVQPIESP